MMMETNDEPRMERIGCTGSYPYRGFSGFATGQIGRVLGARFATIDSYPTRVRLPDQPLMLVDRITEIDGEPLLAFIAAEAQEQAALWDLRAHRAQHRDCSDHLRLNPGARRLQSAALARLQLLAWLVGQRLDCPRRRLERS